MPAQCSQLVSTTNAWEVDVIRRELRLLGGRGALGGRAFDILEALVRSPGELVSKDELMDRVWAGAIVEENTLQVHISALRKALGPSRGLLKTVSGRGYRLLGDWTLAQHGAPAARLDRAVTPLPANPQLSSNLPAPGTS